MLYIDHTQSQRPAIAVKRMETELAQPMLPFAAPEPAPEPAGLFEDSP